MNDWHYDTAADLEHTLVERLKNFPREPDMTVYALRSLAALLLRGWLRLYHRLEIVGRERLPQGRSFVLVANHASHLDTPCLLAALPLKKLHRAFPAAAADYFFQSVPGVWLAAVVVNALPFDRRVHKRQSLALCRALLDNPAGNVLILFPEGTRSVTGELGEFKAGIGLLLAGTEVPAVPCHLDGAGAAFPKDARFPRPGQVRLVVGEPRSYAHVEPGKAGALAVARDLEEAVAALGR